MTDAVESFLGVELVLCAHGNPFTLRAWGASVQLDDVATSLHLPAAVLAPTTQQGGFTFWAGHAGAFVDLSADLSYALALAGDTIVLDHHLAGLSLTAGLFGVDDAAAINQAVGVLIAAGHPPSEAHDHLDRIALRDGQTVVAAAHQLLRAPPGHDPV